MYVFQTETEPFRKKFYEDRLLDKDGKMKFNTLEHGIRKVREVSHDLHFHELC